MFDKVPQLPVGETKIKEVSSLRLTLNTWFMTIQWVRDISKIYRDSLLRKFSPATIQIKIVTNRSLSKQVH